MPDYNSYDRGPRRSIGDRPRSSASGIQPGISRGSAPRRSAPPRPAGARPAPRPQGSRPAGARPAPRPQGSRPQGARPAPRPQNPRYAGGRPSQPQRRRKPSRNRTPLGVYVGALLVVALLVFGGVKLLGPKSGDPNVIPTVEPGGVLRNANILSATPDPNGSQQLTPPAASSDDEEEQDNAPKISKSDQVQISTEQLHINSSLPSEWLNVLLLGTDERWLDEPARTDTMIIASINTKTGEVKLTSLLRDTAVDFYDLPKNAGTYRLNAANYFGGPLYAIKTINELLNMNIQYYVSVNFYGFTRIAEALGGIDVDISEAEMNEINKKQISQAVVAATVGVAEEGIPNELLETYGPNTHLNGRQTLAYARVRYVDNDYARTERQRTVIIKLTEKLRGKSLIEIAALMGSLAGNVTTNLNLDTAVSIAYTVLSSGLSNIDTLHLPRNDTYKIERRNNQEMLYDTDWSKNQSLLYNFIYT